MDQLPPDGPAIGHLLLESARYRFRSLKDLGRRAIEQLSDADLFWRIDPDANNIVILIQHLAGNMVSRWTDFLTTDGEKNRDRDAEFETLSSYNRDELLRVWDSGWHCALNTLAALRPEDLAGEVTIRGEKIGVIDAIERQLSHTAYHVGQIVMIAKHRKGSAWKSLSIAKDPSRGYRPRTRD